MPLTWIPLKARFVCVKRVLKVVTLDGEERDLKQMTVITVADKPVALAVLWVVQRNL